jgi:enoyl-CoA hydratase
MIERSDVGPVAVIRMAHGKASALDVEFLLALSAAFDEVAASGSRAVVLTGRGSIFGAGVDLIRLLEGGRPYLETFLPALSACFLGLFRLPKPTVAAINGHAIAGGCVLACACDQRIMARGRWRIGVNELIVGVPFPLAVVEIMRAAMAANHARTAVLTGRTYGPDEALACGLVDELSDEPSLLERATTVAAGLAAIPAGSYRLTKETLVRPALEACARHGPEADRRVLEAWGSEDVQRAVRAYVEKTLRR